MTQKQALDLLMMGYNVYLTGQAGSGKTFLLNQYIDFLKQNKVPVAVTATTGIAATHLNGVTIHSWSGLGIKSHIQPSDIARIRSNHNTKTRIQSAKVLIIDEISMFHSYRLDALNIICKEIRHSQDAFGGLQVVLCGDFFQLPPVNETGFETSSFVFKSSAWEELDLKICYLNEQHRQWDDQFLKVLNAIRSNELDEFTFEKLSSRLNQPPLGKVKPTKLYTHNTDVDAINSIELEKIAKPEKVYYMTSHGDRLLVDTLKKGCLAPEELILKQGAMVMFIKNNPSKGYVNGTLGNIIGFDESGFPLVRTYQGKEIPVGPSSWSIEDNDLILAEIAQIPLRLAWAITVHKSQGMSLDAAEIDLSKSFTYGMGYVALSRVRSLEGIKLLGINQMAMMVDGQIGEMDKILQKTSKQISQELKGLDKKTVISRQKDFLESLKSIIYSTEPQHPENFIKESIEKFFT